MANVHRLVGVVIVGSPVGSFIKIMVCPAIQDSIIPDAVPYRGCRTGAGGVSLCNQYFADMQAYVSLPNPESISLSSDSLTGQRERNITRV
mgnify:CR=1 FL=1